MADVDKPTKRAVIRGEIRKEVAGAVSEGQIKVQRERGRQRRSGERLKTKERIRERQESEAARVAAYAQKADIQRASGEQRRLQRVQTQRDLAAIQQEARDAREPSTISKVGDSVGGTVTKSSIWGTIVTLTGLFFVMIVAYVIVANGGAFGQLTSRVGIVIASLSSNNPLYVSTPKVN